MEEYIKNIQLKFSCNANWEAMTPDGDGRFCNRCQKKVYDFTDSKAAEFQQILAENNYNVCGRFTMQQMATEPILLPKWKKWLSAALVLIGITLTHCKSTKIQTLTGDTVSLPPIDSAAISMQNHFKDAKPDNKL
jgi:hypothetical protein